MPKAGTRIPPHEKAETAQYVVWRHGDIYYCKRGLDGSVVNQGADPALIINWAFNQLGTGGIVFLRAGAYTLIVGGIVFSAYGQTLQGEGESTIIDGTGLPNFTHAINLVGHADCTIRDLAVETDAGGGQRVNCISIADGADNFNVDHVVIVDSDTDGIHISGTNILNGHIHDCHIWGGDEVGICVNMDVANYMYRLHIVDSNITGTGDNGIHVENRASYAVFSENIVFTTGGHGISISGSTHCSLNNNISFGNTYHGIYLVASDQCVLEGNVCQANDVGLTNTYDGIMLDVDSVENDIIGNNCFDNDRQGITIWGLRNNIVGNFAQENQFHGIHISGAECSILSNYVVDNSQHGVGLYNGINLAGTADRCLINNNYLSAGPSHDMQEDGIHLDDGATDCSIVGNYCYYLQGDGILLAGNNSSCSVEANHCFYNSENGITIIDSLDCMVNGNFCEENVHHGIYLSNTDRAKVINNSCNLNDRLDSTTYDGIFLTYTSDDCQVNNNYCYQNHRDGIGVAGDDCQVKDNYLIDNDEYGIHIYDTAAYNEVQNNYFNANDVGCILESGIDTRLSEIPVLVSDPDFVFGLHPCVRLVSGADTSVFSQVLVPMEFQELVRSNVILVAQTSGIVCGLMATEFGRICTGESTLTHVAQTNYTLAGLVSGGLECLLANHVFSGLVGGDLVGFELIRHGSSGTITGDVYYMGMRIQYV